MPLSQTKKPDHRSGKTGEGTRERILAAALQLFSAKGVCGASTREIARSAEISEVTLFRHFPTKEQLLGEVINRYSLSEVQELIPDIVDYPYEEGLAILASQLLTKLDGLRDWIKILHDELQHSPDRMHKIYHSFLDTLFATYASYFRAMQQRGSLRDFDPELAARAFHGMLFSFFNIEEILQRKSYRATERSRAVAEFVRIFAAGTERRESPEELANTLTKGGTVKKKSVSKEVELCNFTKGGSLDGH
ncbi:TetR family transcriptional regulator [Geobacter argillaceus]|uniref:TetR family transcriptional regulator n=2 Tax=Geobacter argillaceus TaxID=345631 RepID=A0A562WRW0_9BACT|nr:TetR family transcriptional regulator [Geobacter argillaceus]